jgi:hypothetical protein
MRSGSPAHDGRGWSSAQHPYQGRGPRPEQDAPYGPEVSWPSGFRAVEFDSGEYRALVESSYERDDYSHVDPQRGGTAGRQPYGDPRPGGQAPAGHRPGDPRSGDPRYGDQPYGGRPVPGRRVAGGYPQPDDPGRGDPGYGDPGYSDPGYADPGYGDPGYADPGYDGPRGYQAPPRPDFRHQMGPAAGPVSKPEPIYPVTGAQEILREPVPRPVDPRPVDPRPVDPRPVDPRLAGLRYDELRYDDSDHDDRGFSRYDEPLDDEAWYAELRPGGRGRGQDPAPRGRAADFPPAGGLGSGQRSAGRPGPSGGPGIAGSGPAARNITPGNNPGPRMSARPATAPPVPARGLPRTPGSSGFGQASAGFAPSRDRGFLGAPVAQVGVAQVGVLTPPAGSKYGTDTFTGPETVAWSMEQEVEPGEVEVLEEYWEQDESVEYTALLADLDDAPVGPDTGAQIAITRQGVGRRRGRSGDRRLWLGLGGVVAVAAAAIFLIIKFEFPADAGPAHTLSMPEKIGSSFVSSKGVDQGSLNKLRNEFVQMTHGHATDVLAATYESGGVGMGAAPQIVMTIDAHFPNDNAAASIAGFMQDFTGAIAVPAGPLGGQAACAESNTGNADNMAICAWFDNDSFGVELSPSMNANALAGDLQTFRSAVEHVTRS